jgi:hypothetical protein
MASVICTLFEGNYHYGVAAIVNSLYKQGFRGHIYAGYRGSLPPWADKAQASNFAEWPSCHTLRVADGLLLHFLPITDTDYHLTNYKPDFMLKLWAGIAKEADGMLYFDPDIIVTAKWAFFEDWIRSGVALCEDVNSPIPKYHPRRVAWRNYFEKYGINLNFKEAMYANGGFTGVHQKDIAFLELWKQVQEAMAHSIGGLNKSQFNNKAVFTKQLEDGITPFSKTDQDALNAAVEAWDGRASFIGQESMAFKPGPRQMSHALGSPKPWMAKPLLSMLKGKSPRLTDRDYWQYANHPIAAQTNNLVKWRKVSMQIASAVGYFYGSK